MAILRKLFSRDRRAEERHVIDMMVPVQLTEQVVRWLRIANISMTGCQADCPAELTSGDTIVLDLPEIGPREAILVWRLDRQAGYHFRHILAAQDLDAVLAAASRGPVVAFPAALSA